MGRRRKPNQNPTRTITVHVDDELAQLLDQYMFQFGLESRGDAVAALTRAAMSAIPLQGLESEMLRLTMKQIRAQEYESLTQHFEQRAALHKLAFTP